MTPEWLYFLLGLMTGMTSILLFERVHPRHMETYGRAPKAEVWMPDLDARPPQEEMSDDDVARLESKRQSGEGDPTWSEDTVSKGVENLKHEYARAGVPLSDKEAREEVMLMLNSQTGEME